MTDFRDKPPPLTGDELFQQAITCHKAGQFQEAERLYRTILNTNPQHLDVNHNLGMLALQAKKPVAALPYLKAALEGNPNQGQYWFSYINALIQAGQKDVARNVLAQGRQRGVQGEAINALTERLKGPSPDEINTLEGLLSKGHYTEAETVALRLTERFPWDGYAWKALARALKFQGRTAEALKPMEKAANLSPQDAEAHGNLGIIFKLLGRIMEAEACYRRALEIRPDYVELRNNLGNILRGQGRFVEAESCYRRALEIKPDYAEAHNNLGVTLREQGRLTDAEVCHRRALELRANYIEAYSNLGITLQEQGRLGDAEVYHRQALEINPDYAEAHNNLGNAFQEQGRLEEAEACYRQALQIKPDFVEAQINLAVVLNSIEGRSFSDRLEQARNYGRLIAQKAGHVYSTWLCDPLPQRLRVGLVSGDIGNHPVGMFLEAFVPRISFTSIELIAYPTVQWEDDLTRRLKPCFTAWKPISGLSDEAAARMIYEDGIHVLLDLAGHTRHNRLPVFAWKPAPIQASWLGYYATTGVPGMDYLLGDPYVTPLGEENHFTETVWRFPESYVCFTPPPVAVDEGPLPALSVGRVTFGSFNNLTKMNDSVVALWSRVLQAVPDSRLFLKAKHLGDPAIRDSVLGRFDACGIASDRLLLEGGSPRSKLLESYNRVDIALDPFPYPGGVTSMEALWMGVPVITRRGDRFLSHVGECIAHNTGMAQWIAADDEDYICKAATHAADLQHLSELRAGLRRQVLASPVFDYSRFAQHVEEAFWAMWEKWLAANPSVADGN